VRHMEAPLTYKLALRCLRRNDVIPLAFHNKKMHIYLAKPKVTPDKKRNAFQRIFVRGLVRQLDREDGVGGGGGGGGDGGARARRMTRTRVRSARWWRC